MIKCRSYKNLADELFREGVKGLDNGCDVDGPDILQFILGHARKTDFIGILPTRIEIFKQNRKNASSKSIRNHLKMATSKGIRSNKELWDLIKHY